MLIKLTLTNFKKHEDLTVNFTGGLNAIRGSNENGKSSVLRAVAFAFFGARALELPVDDTVTWGKPASALKVELVFAHSGKTYTITRKKSGAELIGDNGETASGQAEVTGFVEKLFGANAAIAHATMLANQSSLQDGLDSSAMPLIEKLANMRLIDELIDKVQTKLPSGSTKSLEIQLHSVPERAKPEPVSTASTRLEVAALESMVAKYNAEIEEAKAVVTVIKRHATEGQRKQTKNEQNTALRSQLESQMLAQKPKIEEFENSIYVPVDIEFFRSMAKDKELAADVSTAFDLFKALPIFEVMETEALITESSKLRNRLGEIAKQKQELQTEIALAQASKVAEGVCGFCGQDFTELPEVKTKQALVQAKLEELSKVSVSLLVEENNLSKELIELKAYEANDAVLDKKLQPLRKYVTVDLRTTPRRPIWEGGEVPKIDTKVDYDKLLKEAIADEKAHNLLKAGAQSAQVMIKELTARLDTIVNEELSVDELKAMLMIGEQESELKEAESILASGKSKLQGLKHKLEMVALEHEMQVKTYEKEVEQRKQLLELLSAHNFHNGIISKLREARPAVAAKLWALVLTGVSHYFSQIRGTQSTVTRGEKGFLIDGKVMEAYSGSTKDSLGLSIRIMLQKTFLPNVNFMLADEPGSGCDDNRESDMLAALAGSGLDQVILVTHSDLADTFAASVTQI